MSEGTTVLSKDLSESIEVEALDFRGIRPLASVWQTMLGKRVQQLNVKAPCVICQEYSSYPITYRAIEDTSTSYTVLIAENELGNTYNTAPGLIIFQYGSLWSLQTKPTIFLDSSILSGDRGNGISTSANKDAPYVYYDPDVLREISKSLPVINEVINLGIVLGKKQMVPIAKVRISRFVSMENPTYKELVASFFSSAPQEQLIEFFPLLAQEVGDWRRLQSDSQQYMLSQLSVEVMPLEFWEDV